MKIYMKNPTGINWSSCAYHIKLSLLEDPRLKVSVLIKAIVRIICNKLINPAGLLGVAGHYHPVLHVICHRVWWTITCQSLQNVEIGHNTDVIVSEEKRKKWILRIYLWLSDCHKHWYCGTGGVSLPQYQCSSETDSLSNRDKLWIWEELGGWGGSNKKKKYSCNL